MFNTQRSNWRKLDNAAKIFPATSNRRDTRVFRFYCECRDTIDKTSLQMALDKTVEKYPLFLAVMRRGLFWFYLEKSDIAPVVKEENEPPCLNLYLRDQKTLLFQVSYYENRINFEVYHALTDGTGASNFLKELVKNYLLFRYADAGISDIPLTVSDMTVQDQESDGFSKYYKRIRGKKPQKLKTAQLSGPKITYGELNITERTASCQTLLSKSKEYGVSITVLLSAALICAIHEEMNVRQMKRPIALMVPVNLRKFFPSASMLNFFGWIEPFYLFKERDYRFEDVVEKISEYFRHELTSEGLSKRFGGYMSLERNPLLRFFPLVLKNLAMQLTLLLTRTDFTAFFSNLGIIELPSEYAQYIQRFGVFTSTPKIELSMCSFQDETVLSFASGFRNQNVERNFFRILKGLGIETTLLESHFPAKTASQPVAPYAGMKFFEFFSFGCIAAAVICFMVNSIITPHVMWWTFVCGGALSMWVTLAIGFFKRHNLLKNGLWQMFVISTACIIWDKCTGWNGWSVDYVMPAVFLCVEISMVIITHIQRLAVEEYMIYYIMAGIMGLIPAVLLALHISHFAPLSVLCSGISFLWLAALLIFKRKNFFVELYKKLHF